MSARGAPYRWAILAVCVAGFMQTHVHRVGFAPLIPTFIADMGLTYAAAGTIMAAYFWSYAVMQIPVGVQATALLFAARLPRDGFLAAFHAAFLAAGLVCVLGALLALLPARSSAPRGASSR